MTTEIAELQEHVAQRQNGHTENRAGAQSNGLSSLGGAALDYAARGWFVLPLKPRGKTPLTQHGLKDATIDPAALRAWWKQWPGANIGIACEPSGLAVIDIDAKSGGMVTLDQITSLDPLCVDTLISRTGGGGLHLVFEGSIPNTAGRIGAGIDTRGSGGYIVAPPSVHESGKVYCWEDDTAKPEPLPDFWRVRLNGHTTKQSRARNNTLAGIAGDMRRKGMTPEAIEAALLVTNQEKCTPPLPENDVKAIARSIPKKKRKQHAPTDDELSERWLKAHPLTAYGLGDWRRYAQGVWTVVPEDEISREIREILIDAKGEGVRPSRYGLSSVAEMARLTVSLPSEQWDADPDMLVCRNGALKISTRELLPHDPAQHVIESLPFDYDPAADAPTWRYVLDSTIPEAAGLLQEFAGYSLTTDTSLETALWLYGLPGGGRSTVIGGIEAMLGSRAGVLGLAAVERSQFALTGLPGKTLVTSTEQPNLFIRSAHILNALISGEPLVVEKKYEHPYQIIPRAKILWAMNDLPRISEVNSGLFRRVKVIHFPPRAEAQRDPAIKERVKLEAAGILNWALVGLDRLRQRGRFGIPLCVQEATAEFKATNDIPLMFVNEMCLTGPEYRTQSSKLYTAYSDWCKDTGHKAQSSTSLADDWKRLEFERYRAAGKTHWRGVGLVDSAMPEG